MSSSQVGVIIKCSTLESMILRNNFEIRVQCTMMDHAKTCRTEERSMYQSLGRNVSML